MLDLIELIVEQLFEKMLTISYSIRQFCKCLYQQAKNKFSTEKDVDEVEMNLKLVNLVSSFLLDKWILNSLFVNLKMEGLIKDFNLPRNCFENLRLMSKIIFSLLTR